MPTYKMMLTVEVDAPEDPNHPELTLTSEDVVEALLDMQHLNKYHVWRGNKLTGNVRVLGVTRVKPH